MMMLAPRRHSDGHGRRPDRLVIGLVNNMPPNAMQATEEEFTTVLNAAAEGFDLELHCFALPGFRRRASDRVSLCPHYEELDAIWSKTFDGLIVTGTEPVMPDLVDEPYWPALAKLVEWAADHTSSAIWSCLAAQAAVLRLDGVARRTLPEKVSGVFACVREGAHPLLAGAPPSWPVPHSRQNDLDAAGLVEHGYEVLSHAPGIGADMFAKHVGNSLFLCLQGHPEYGADCLLREYRRDIRRYLLGQREAYPGMPAGYFDDVTVAALSELREQATQKSSLEFLGLFDTVTRNELAAPWRPQAVRLYSNWLRYLAEEKAAQQLPGVSVARGVTVS